MKQYLLLLIVTFWGTSIFAQPESNPETENEINQQIWKAFKQSWERRDSQTFNALHTEDIMRVSSSGIRVGDEYKNSNQKSFSKPRKDKRTIDFALEQRLYGNDIGYEVGYYRIVSKKDNGETNHYYGRFHVVLKKQNGAWKIAQDWDTGNVNGVEVTAADFEKLAMLPLSN